MATNVARANFDKDAAIRLWATKHGGIYVPIDSQTPPNPYLSHIPERDIETPSGRKLTLMNPAYMLRQIMNEFGDLYGIQGRITSLKFLNPINTPDAWEKKVLHSFDTGTKEAFEFSDIDGKPHLRLMHPIITVEGCLKCHAFQGYKVGDVRGGVGVSVPMAPYLAAERFSINAQAITHATIWILGMGVIVITTHRSRQSNVERLEADRILRDHAQMYHQMFENDPAVKLLIDPDDGSIVDANHTAADYYGYTVDRLKAMNISQIRLNSPERLNDSIDEANITNITNIKERLLFACHHRLASGDIRDVEVYTGLIEVSGKTCLHSIVHDVTDRNLQTANLLKKTIDLERSNEELRQFAYVTSHDLNEPLNVIEPYVHILGVRYQDKLDNDANESLHYITESVHLMRALIRDILAYSQVNSRGAPFTKAPMDILLDKALSIHRNQIEIKKASVTHDPLPVLDVDPTQITLLFRYLIGNAIKFSKEETPPVVHIGAERHIKAERAGYEWIISVSDNGVGIDPRHFERIFLMFQRLHPRHDYPGTGAGLTISKRIVERHGGRIWVESEPGKGSTIYFSLPERVA